MGTSRAVILNIEQNAPPLFEKGSFGKKQVIWQADFFITNFVVKSCLSYTYCILMFVYASFVEEGTGGSLYGTATQQWIKIHRTEKLTDLWILF